MMICVVHVIAVFCAITALTQVTVEAFDRRNVVQETQVESIDMHKPAQGKQGTSKRAYCPGEYRCLSDDCIPISWICDGMDDCPDGDDERVCRDPACDRFCPKNGGCKGWQGKCSGYCYCYGSGYAHFCDQCGA